MKKTVTIDCLVQSQADYREDYAFVAVDVIRSTTSAMTAVSTGRRCFPVATLGEAFRAAAQLLNPVLAGELGGDIPVGFHMNSSPAALAVRTDTFRPLVLLSSTGAQLVKAGEPCDATYIASFRNAQATARFLAGLHPRIAVVGAASRGEFCLEDQICCAWIAHCLMQEAYEPGSRQTELIVEQWAKAPAADCLSSKSVNNLMRNGQLEDLEFILSHVNDLPAVFSMECDEVKMLPFPRRAILRPPSRRHLQPQPSSYFDQTTR